MLSPAYTLTPTPSKGMIVACLADITQHNSETLIKHAIRLKKKNFGSNHLVATSSQIFTVATDQISQIYMMQRPSLAHIIRQSSLRVTYRDPHLVATKLFLTVGRYQASPRPPPRHHSHKSCCRVGEIHRVERRMLLTLTDA